MTQPERGARTGITASANAGIDEPMIERLVHRFYEKARADALLGPVFAAKVDDWPHHLAQICRFWSSVMTLSAAYQGRPMPKHMVLPIDAEHFDRWLALFEETARELCPPIAAEHFTVRARRIAQSLEFGVAHHAGASLRAGERFRRVSG